MTEFTAREAKRERASPESASRDQEHVTGSIAWLWVALSAFLPLILALFLPAAFMLPLFGVAAALLVSAFVLFVRNERGKHARS